MRERYGRVATSSRASSPRRHAACRRAHSGECVTEPHVAEDAIAYLSGEVTHDRRAAVEAHLSECDRCRSEYDAVGVALAALADWPRAPQLPSQLERRLLAAVRRRRSRPWARRI